jgi:hypothetical protein
MTIKVELPDIERLMELIGKISELMLKEAGLDIEIKLREAEITKSATTDSNYSVNGKSPSQTYIDNTWKYTGFNGELVPMRMELANLHAQLDATKREYDLLRSFIDIWRTQSANERTSY